MQCMGSFPVYATIKDEEGKVQRTKWLGRLDTYG